MDYTLTRILMIIAIIGAIVTFIREVNFIGKINDDVEKDLDCMKFKNENNKI